MSKQELLSLTKHELEELLLSLGEPRYRAAQIFPQLYRGLAPAEMTNVGKATAEKLNEVAVYRLPRVKRKLVSAKEAQAMLGISRPTLRAYVKRGVLEQVNFSSRKVRFDEQQVSRLVYLGVEGR